MIVFQIPRKNHLSVQIAPKPLPGGIGSLALLSVDYKTELTFTPP